MTPLDVLRAHLGEPSQAQKEAGDYPMRSLTFQGLPIKIETDVGEYRRGTDATGDSWEVRMHYPYGFIDGSLGTDGDEVDCFIGESPDAPTAYVIRAMRRGAWHEYDEDKVMLGFDSLESAKRAFLLSYDDPRFMGDVFEVPVAALAAKLRSRRGQMLKSRALFFRKLSRS